MKTFQTTLLLIAFILAALITSCDKKRTQSHKHSADMAYTCPMHPTVVREKPGQCPICGMDLVPVLKSEAAKKYVMLSDRQMKLANITTKPVRRNMLGQTSTINGTLAINKSASEVISSRVAGRIERLAVKETGLAVQKGQQLYSIFSEQILTLEQEYLLAKEQYEKLGNTEKRYKSFLDAAKRKLLLFGLTENQISQLKDQKSLSAHINFISPATGIVTEINATEGQYVAEGGPLYTIEDLSTLWVEAELFPNETAVVRTGDKIKVSVVGATSDPIETKVTFLSPELRANTQIVVMRAEINNPNLKFKPGQQVNISFTYSEKETISLPVDAVVRNQSGAHVYVQNGRNTFLPRMVKTGLENDQLVEITQGLTEHDTVAISGAYLIYSEMILKKGSDPMASHSH